MYIIILNLNTQYLARIMSVQYLFSLCFMRNIANLRSAEPILSCKLLECCDIYYQS